MNARLLTIAIEGETDIIAARQRTRQLAAGAGFDLQDQTRITTAVSEIVRNVLEYAGSGRIEYALDDAQGLQSLDIVVSDKGRGIPHLDDILAGLHQSATGLGVGILGARRLMDEFDIKTAVGQGTTVRLKKYLPHRAPKLTPARVKDIAGSLTRLEAVDPLSEVRRQNREILLQLDELNSRQQQLEGLNQELQDTNRGVVALYAELNDRAESLRRADELKSRFLSNMSHEFRTPLNSIMALSRLLMSRADGPLTPEQQKQVEFIRKGALSLTDLVNDLLDLAKVEAGKTTINAAEFSVQDLFGALRGMLRPLLVGDAVALVFDDPSDLLPLLTDEAKVSQILRNFISNALKFTERGEVRVSAAAGPEPDSITFKVRDTGVGIAPQDREVIWQEFGQAANPMQARVKGTGLGLPLSKKLAELLQGSVGVESVPGQGSVFWVTVPRFYQQPAEGSDIEHKWQVQPSKLPVLVLEDDAADAFSYERFLADSRYQIIPARSVAEAHRAMERVTPAAAVLDIVLKAEESWRFLIDLKHSEKTQNIPIIVSSSSQDEHKARSLGADDYLNKPLDAEKLIAALDRLTGHRTATNVLVVDDQEVFRYLVQQLLPRGVFRLRQATAAAEGLREIAAEKPDVVLLDLNMDEMDGFAFLDHLQNEAAPPPVIVVSSLVLTPVQRARLHKAAAIVSKSDLTAATLIGAIRNVVPMSDVAAE